MTYYKYERSGLLYGEIVFVHFAETSEQARKECQRVLEYLQKIFHYNFAVGTRSDVGVLDRGITYHSAHIACNSAISRPELMRILEETSHAHNQ